MIDTFANPPGPTETPTPILTEPVVTPTATAPKEDYGSYLVLKGGWFGSSNDYQGESFSGAGEWEVAVGTGRVLGIAGGVVLLELPDEGMLPASPADHENSHARSLM